MNSLVLALVIFSTALAAAQQKKAVTFQEQVQQQNVERRKAKSPDETTFRVYGDFYYASVRSSELNDYRSRVLWNGTTVTPGAFSAPIGFSIGAGYFFLDGFWGLEFSRLNEELGSTTILATTTTVRDGFDFEKLSLSYDYLFQTDPDYSFEAGIAIGTSLKYRFYNYLETSSVSEVIYWQDTPLIYTFRGAANYHFSHHVRARLGAGYEMVSSNKMASDADHAAQSISKGQVLRDTNGSAVNVDMSGFRITAGLVVGF